MFCSCGFSFGLGRKLGAPNAAELEHVAGPRPVNFTEPSTGVTQYRHPITPAHLTDHPLYQFVTHLSENLPREKVFEPAPVGLPKKDHIVTKMG
jgi:hypothetical protein